MSNQRVARTERVGVGASYLPLDRCSENISVQVKANGNTFTVDYTLDNIIRGPSSSYDVSSEGLELPANALWSNLIASGSVDADFRGILSPYAVRLNVTAAGDNLLSAAIAEDGGAFTDQTAAANEATANDMTLFPAVAVALVDRYNFGFPSKVPSFDLTIGTAGTGTYTVIWEYFNGTIWVPLVGVVDATTNFQTVARNTVSWTVPTDWAASIINGQGPFYYVRAVLQAGTMVVDPAGTQGFDTNVASLLLASQSDY